MRAKRLKPTEAADPEPPEAATPKKPRENKPRRAYLPAQERRRLIIEAAREVFTRNNLHGARTRDIAKAAEINQATLFEHFDSKEALFHAAVVEPLVEALRGMHERAKDYEASATVEQIRVLAEGSARRQIETMTEIFPLYTAALFSDLETGQKLYREQIKPLLADSADAISGLVRPGLDLEIVELAIYGIIFAFAMDNTLGDKKRDIKTLADHLTAIGLTGFAKDPWKTVLT